MEALTVQKPLPLAVKQKRRPYIYWYLSLRCNLACKHCWVNSSPNVDTSGDLTLDQMLAAVDNIARMNAAGVLLTGGEPTYHPGIIPLLQALAERRIPIAFETNAMLITDELLAVAQEIQRSGLRIDFTASLDGGNAQSHDWIRGKGGFEQTVNGLRRLSEAGLTIEAQCTLNRRNWQSVGDLVKVANTLNLRYLKFGLTNPVGRATRFTRKLMIPFSENYEVLRALADALEDYRGNVIIKTPPAMIPPDLQARLRNYTSPGGCAVSNVTSCSFPLLGVLPDGSVTICAASRDTPEAYYGDIRTVELSDIWNTSYFVELRENYLDSELTGICGDCIFKKECLGACRAHALAENGSFEGPYPVCNEMAEAGEFPDMYRISHLEALTERARTAAATLPA